MDKVNTKARAQEIYNQFLPLAATDGRMFRKTVMDTLMADMGVTLASAATHYNNCKKAAAPVEGLGRAPTAVSAIKKTTAKKANDVQDDECYTVLELLTHADGDITVGRNRSHLMQGDASEDFDERIEYKPANSWVLIKGLGPLYGETFKLSATESEVKRYTPESVVVVAKEEPLLVD